MELMQNVGHGYNSEINLLVADGVLISQHSNLDWCFQYLATGTLISGYSLGLRRESTGWMSTTYSPVSTSINALHSNMWTDTKVHGVTAQKSALARTRCAYSAIHHKEIIANTN